MKELILKLDNLFERLVKGILIILTSTIMGVVFVEVIMRYIFHSSLYWAEEIARFSFVWMVMLGSAFLLRESGHVAVTFVTQRVKGVLKKVLDISVYLLINFFVAIVFLGGLSLAKQQINQLSPTLGFPMWIIYLVFPISAFLMFFWNSIKLFRINHEDIDK